MPSHRLPVRLPCLACLLRPLAASPARSLYQLVALSCVGSPLPSWRCALARLSHPRRRVQARLLAPVCSLAAQPRLLASSL
ncbi:hypothetical protein PR202_ga19957 [Eleusine coracana subsp. coracana]|uniref:Secreted protein n=1 Tax=Eleusine coracana subsp. coracana TaxID=191504 RepID=A0AAV5CWN7_ELECO|nr:hypothetical protein PR202_ga19957 [Eleusine coracana subsp. coracana]